MSLPVALRNPLNLLLVLIPVALVARVLSWPAIAIFAISGLAIIPLAKWMGTATEELAVHVGPGIGGLLNATFGNATELIRAAGGPGHCRQGVDHRLDRREPPVRARPVVAARRPKA